jgi:predicted phage-related endonuclease
VTIIYHPDVVQGSDEWHEMRRGVLTASEMSLILTAKTLKQASNDKERAHVWEIAAQRISRHVEPSYIGENMLRGWDDENTARELYGKHFAPVTEVGFVTTDHLGFTIGYSPDGLVGDDGLIEAKSRKQKFQIETLATQKVPDEYQLQLQTGLLVTGRKWIDFLSYSGGLPMAVIRVEPDPDIQEAIIAAALAFEARVQDRIAEYHAALAGMRKVIQTARRVEQEMFV